MNLKNVHIKCEIKLINKSLINKRKPAKKIYMIRTERDQQGNGNTKVRRTARKIGTLGRVRKRERGTERE